MCATVLSQTGFVKGKIIDAQSRETVPGATVRIDDHAVLSSVDGLFSIETPEGRHHISVQLTGYMRFDSVITVPKEKTLQLRIALKSMDLELDAVVVSAGRFEQKVEDVSVSMSVIKPELIQNKATISCETIIEQVPGVTVQDGQVSIRGGSGYAYGAGSRVLLMVDELPYLSGDAGDAKWNTIPVENIEQIEVIKGASSVLYGSSALNGVINIRTGYPGKKPETRINLQQGIYGNPRRSELIWWDENPYFTGANFYHSRRIRENFDLTLGGNVLSAVGYRQGEDEDRIRFNFNTRYRSKKFDGLSFGLNGNAQFAKTGVFVLWQSDSAGYVPAGGANPNNPSTTLTFQDGARLFFDPYLVYYGKKNNRHSVRSRWFRTNNVNSQGRGSLSDFLYGEYQYQKSFDSLRLNLTSGISTYKNIVASDLYGKHDGNNAAAFFQADKKFGTRWSVNAGIRMEYFKLDSAETVSSFTLGSTKLPFQPVVRTGVTFRLFEHTILRSSWGQGYRFPSIAEKFASTNVGIVSIFPNPDLQPERGWSGEVGIKQGLRLGSWNGYLDVAWFWTEYKDMIEFTFDSYIPPGVVPSLDPNSPIYLYKLIGFQARNSEDARITGIDVSLVGTGKIGAVNTTVFAGYTFMNPVSLNTDSSYRATFSDSTSNMLKYRVKHLAKADIQFDYRGFSFGISARYNSNIQNIDRTFEDLVIDFNGFIVSFGDQILPGLPDYRKKHDNGALVFDSRLSYDLNKNSRIALIVNNVLNAEYTARPGDIRPPRTFIVQFSINF